MRLTGTVVGVCALAAVLSSCSGSSKTSSPGSSGSSGNTASTGSAGSTASAGSSGTSGASTTAGASSSAGSTSPGTKVVDGGTFTMALAADPGNLDPQSSAASAAFQVAQFAYDSLLSQDAQGKINSGLATEWTVQGPKVVMTLHKAITCSDGSAFTAADAAANLNYVGNPKNKSPYLGVLVPAGSKATADAAAGTVTLNTGKLAPFVLNAMASLPMVCAAGMKNRKLLATHTDGTGSYQLTEAASGDHYTFTKRSGYTWGPNGATTATAGLPSKIILKVTTNGTTAANLLLSGGLNAATVVGPDVQRLQSAHLFTFDVTAILGEMWYNQTKARPGADPAVRQALTRAVDLGQLAKVLTSGRGTPGTAFTALPPTACPGNSIAAALAPHDLAKAKQLLDAAGWKAGTGGVRARNGKPLAVTFVYSTGQGSAGSAAAELAAAAWKQLGVNVTLKAQDETAINTTLFSSGNWDVVWEGLNTNSPDQIVPFMSGAVPPNGTNFAHVNNAAYNALAAKAATVNGSKGCPTWLQAESKLVSDADVIPFANQVTTTFGNHAQFVISGELVPTSIRMTAG